MSYAFTARRPSATNPGSMDVNHILHTKEPLVALAMVLSLLKVTPLYLTELVTAQPDRLVSLRTNYEQNFVGRFGQLHAIQDDLCYSTLRNASLNPITDVEISIQFNPTLSPQVAHARALKEYNKLNTLKPTKKDLKLAQWLETFLAPKETPASSL